MAEMSATVRLDLQTLTKLKELANNSDMSIARVANAAIEYALEHARVQKTTKTIEIKTIVFMEG